MPKDYRYNPFDDVAEPVQCIETHVIPMNSPFVIRLNEVPVKDSPSTLTMTIGGVTATEVAAAPASGEFRPDYSTGANDDTEWNTGTIQFNSADAGKTVLVSYNGMGTLVSVNTPRNFQLFTSNGTFTVPPFVEKVYVTGCGGGGGGGGTAAKGAGDGGGAGGGGAACALKQLLVVTPKVSYSVTIGNGGGGGRGSERYNIGGASGGASSFGALLSLGGGGGGGGGEALSGGASGGSGGGKGGIGGARWEYSENNYARPGGNGGGGIFGAGGAGSNDGISGEIGRAHV